MGGAQVGGEFGGNLRSLLRHRCLQPGAQVRARRQRAFQVVGAANFDASGGQFRQHFAQRWRQLLGGTQLRQILLRRHAQPFRFRQSFGRQHPLGKGAGNAGFAAAAQQGAVLGQQLHNVEVVGVFFQRQGKALIRFLAQQFRVRLDNALRFVPRLGGDEAVEQVGQVVIGRDGVVSHLPGSFGASGKVCGGCIRDVILRVLRHRRTHSLLQPRRQLRTFRQRTLQVIGRLQPHTLRRQRRHNLHQRRRHLRRQLRIALLSRAPPLPFSHSPLLHHLAHRRQRVVAQRHRQQLAPHAGNLRQPVVLPCRAQPSSQLAQQPDRHLLILLRARLLRGREDQRRLSRGGVVVGQIEQQRRVDLALRPAHGASHGVQRAGAGAVEQVGALAGVDDQPEIEGKGAATAAAGQVECFG